MDYTQQHHPGVPLSGTTRGQWAENIHTGRIAVVDASGRLLAAAGDPYAEAFMRSTAKPVQAAPSIAAGLMERFGLPEEAIALMSASHRGAPEHIALLERMLELTGVREEQLAFHDDLPLGRHERDEAMRAGAAPRKLYHTCSGKHVGLLAYCRMMGWPLEGYTNPEHPLQQRMLEAVAAFADLEPEEIGRAVDGCGLPVFRLPLEAIALTYARLALPEAAMADDEALPAARRVAEAMLAHPALVEGEGRLASVLLEHGILAKSGAQGMFALAIPQAGIGAAIQVDDGGESAWPVIAAELLDQLRGSLDLAGVLPEDRIDLERLLSAAAEGVRAQFPEVMVSSTGVETGRLRPAFELEWSSGL